MNLNEAIKIYEKSNKLPLKWRRRIGKWLSWNECQIRKMEQWVLGNDQRWTRVVLEKNFKTFLDEMFANKTTVTFNGKYQSITDPTAPQHELYKIIK